ncbi:hypothetical protein VCV18_010783 [Metarhizium anisopliae]
MRVIKPFMASQNAAPKPCEGNPGFVLAGFPSIGKTYLADHPELWPGYGVVDLDLSHYSALECCQIAKEDYLSNAIVLVSANKEMRDELVKNNVHFALVYPPRAAKDEWIERVGSSTDLVNFIQQHWDAMIDSCSQQSNCTKFVIPKGVYLSHMINDLAKRMNRAGHPNI